jgi:hypothetical protein
MCWGILGRPPIAGRNGAQVGADVEKNNSSGSVAVVDTVRHHTGAPMWFKLA